MGKNGRFVLFMLLYIGILNHVDVLLVFQKEDFKKMAFIISLLGHCSKNISGIIQYLSFRN